MNPDLQDQQTRFIEDRHGSLYLVEEAFSTTLIIHSLLVMKMDWERIELLEEEASPCVNN